MGMSHYVQELAIKCISRVGFGSALVVAMLAVSPAVSQSFIDKGKDLLKASVGDRHQMFRLCQLVRSRAV